MADIRYAIWLILQGHKDLIALILLGVFFLLWKRSEVFRAICLSDRLVRRMRLGVIGMMTAYLFMIAVYVVYPNYLQHTQSTIANVSWLAINGQPAYSDWKNGDYYGLMYGPLLYFVNGAFLLLGPGIAMSKVPGILALLSAFCVTAATLKWKGATGATRFFLLGVFVALMAPYGIFGYWNRSEPFLILIGSLSLVAALGPRPLLAAGLVGVLAGIATGFKIHGVFYLIPAALAGLGRIERLPGRLLAGAIGIAASIGAALLPFLWNHSFSWAVYWQYLTVAMDHGFLAVLFEENFCFGLVLLLPLLIVWGYTRPILSPPEKYFLIGLVPPILAIDFMGSTAGAGPHHLLPFLPLSLYGLAIILRAPKSRPMRIQDPSKLAMLIFAWLLLSHVPAFLLESEHSMKGRYDFPTEYKKIAELESLIEKYPKAEMGPSTTAAYADTFYGVLGVFKGAPLHLEAAAWMDLSFDDSPDNDIVHLISGCRVPAWIFPVGAPFTMENFYTHDDLFPEDFRDEFKTRNHLEREGRYFQVWTCNP